MDVNTADKGQKTVYVRPVDKAALSQKLRDATESFPAPYAVHAPNGDRLAIARDETLAFALARRNDFLPVYVH